MSIKIFQSSNGLVADGVVGKKTISKIKEIYKLNKIEAAHFIAQIDHETGGFKYSKENLNYSAKRLLQIFPKYFKDTATANKYAYKPKMIGSRVYANRMGNGSELSGDGYKYKGRGALQLTGYNNYKSFSEYLNDRKVIKNPDIVASKYYLETAIWYFEKFKVFRYCTDISETSVRLVTKAINGGYNGLAHRIELTEKYYRIIKEIERDEKQNNTSTNISTSSDNTVRVDDSTEQEQTNTEDPRPRQKRSFKERFIAPFVRWFIPKKTS